MIEGTACVFVGCLAALITDRLLGAAVQLWGMRRIGRRFMKHIEEQAKRPMPDRRAN